MCCKTHAKTLRTPRKDREQGGWVNGQTCRRQDRLPHNATQRGQEGEGKAFFAKRNGSGCKGPYVETWRGSCWEDDRPCLPLPALAPDPRLRRATAGPDH